MHYVIMDLEWNQPTCYRETIKNPVFLTGEIIQIGAIKLDENFRIVDKFSSLVKPVYYSALIPSVQEVTGLKDWMFSGQPTFPTAAKQFQQWCGADFTFLIWGTSDLQMLRSNLKLYDLDTAWLPESFNLQVPFSMQVTHEQKQCSLERAVAMVGEKQYTAHDALGDAMSTWLLCRHMDMALGLREYQNGYFGEEIYVEHCILEDDYVDTYDALDDDYVVSFECPDCGEIVWCDGWYPQGHRKLVGIGTCPDGTEYFVRLKFSNCWNGFLRVRRCSYRMTDSLREFYNQCKAEWEARNEEPEKMAV